MKGELDLRTRDDSPIKELTRRKEGYKSVEKIKVR